MGSLSRFMDHAADVYAGVETKGTAGSVRTTFGPTKKAAALDCNVQVDRERMAELGPGEVVEALYSVYFDDPDADVEEGDVLNILTGPEAPLTVRVGLCYRPRGKHLEAQAENWQGVIAS